MSEVREAARAVLLTPSETVLLMKMAGLDGDLWITPGGRIHDGEPPEAALERELHEETGLTGVRVGAEIWGRHVSFVVNGVRTEERERFWLVPIGPFDPTTSGMESTEREVFHEFRWWPIEEIVRSTERFAPRRIGEFLATLLRDGPPSSPVETGE